MRSGNVNGTRRNSVDKSQRNQLLVELSGRITESIEAECEGGPFGSTMIRNQVVIMKILRVLLEAVDSL